LPNFTDDQDRRQLAQDLREAVADWTLDLNYQPQINLRTGRVTWFEALLRWRHPVRGNVPPEDFIPLAEETGLIGEIGRQVLERACRTAAAWPEDIGVAVNVSAAQFANRSLPATVAAALQAAGLAPQRLELEITESVLMASETIALEVMQALRHIGVRLAIDDFGVGYSSLGYLVRFPFDKVKIDRLFVSGAGEAKSRSAIVRAVIGLCSSLGITCTAEGVETQEQLAALMHANCPEAQGHLFSPGVAGPDIPGLLARLEPTPGAPTGARRLVTAVDISFFQIAESANDVIIVTTPDLDPPGPTIVYVNPAFSRLTGYSAAEAIGLTPRILQGPGTGRASLDAIRAALKAGRPAREKVLNFAKCGAPYWLDLRITPLRDATGAITHFAAVERDVTMDKRRLDELEFVADRDTLTGIPNRRALLRAIEAEIMAVKALGDSGVATMEPCLAFIDVDHFKRVNDQFGHAVGDSVLFGVADRLAENIRRSDILGRVGGEEFAVCMPNVTLQDARALAERLRRAVTLAPFETPVGPVAVTVSIGVAACKAGDGVTHLMRRADAAMYAAKRAGRDRVRAYSANTQ
jgi:diguanylate cyclase (GGDEF)-like protein/PAS domain S-box-containing protein